MVDEITDSAVYDALGRITHPVVTHRSIRDLGMVAEVEVRGGKVRVVLARIEAYGPSQAEGTARRVGVPLLGSLLLDPSLAVLSDGGRIEDYRSEAFESIVDTILERQARERVEGPAEPVGSGAER